MSTMTLEQVRDELRATADHADSGYDKAWAIRLADAIDAYLREREALKRDAERYRWLRDVAWSLPAIPQEELPACAVFSGSGRRCKDISGEEMDQAIDDAMAKESGE